MTLTEYLEHLTDNNWHTLRELIEFEQCRLEGDRELAAARAYLAARDTREIATARATIQQQAANS
jgi:hypothetical protein